MTRKSEDERGTLKSSFFDHDDLSVMSDCVTEEETFEKLHVNKDTKKVYIWMAAVLGMLSVTAALVISLINV